MFKEIISDREKRTRHVIRKNLTLFIIIVLILDLILFILDLKEIIFLIDVFLIGIFVYGIVSGSNIKENELYEVLSYMGISRNVYMDAKNSMFDEDDLYYKSNNKQWINIFEK